MTGFNDAIAADVIAVVEKTQKIGKGKALVEKKSRVTASLTGGIIRFEIPEEKVNVSYRLQDILTVINAANEAYINSKGKK